MILRSREQLVQRAQQLLARPERALLGITGAPGSGKSTVAAQLLAELGPDAVGVPMDGFHLANQVLVDLGLRAVKGNIATFDDAGYLALLQRLRRQVPPEVVYAPFFDRHLEEAIGSAIAIPATAGLVITEGNYLLATAGHWPAIRALCDEVWYVEVPEEVRLQRLIARHVDFGKPPEVAREWVLRTDEANARLIETTRHTAEYLVRLDTDWPI